MMSKLWSERLNTYLPISSWLPQYKADFFKWDIIAGITLGAFVLPESMAYATLAGLPPYFGIYCCLTGCLVFALFTSSKQLVVGPTSALSLMIGASLAVLSDGNATKWASLAGLTALLVGCICLLAFFLKLSSLVHYISESILLGFKAGAALTIISTQLPKLFGVEGGGRNFFLKISTLINHLPNANWTVFLFGMIALLILIAGDLILPGKPISLLLVIASILVISNSHLVERGLQITGEIPKGLPSFSKPSLGLKEIDGVLDLAIACFLMGYIETISAAKTFAAKNNYTVDPRQELISMGAANIATAFTSAYVVSGGLSQTTVNDKSGAKSPMSLIFCSLTLAAILLYLTGFLKNLPEVILGVIVLHAVSSLIKIKEMRKLYTLSKLEFGIAMTALFGVLFFGILKGVLVAAILALVLLIRRTAHPVVSRLGKIKGTSLYSDISRHPDNMITDQILVLRVESSILYFNAEYVHERIIAWIRDAGNSAELLVLDLSASPYLDVEGSKMLVNLSRQLLSQKVTLRVVEALSKVRDILRVQGMEAIVGKISRKVSIDDAIQEFRSETKNDSN